MSQSFRIPAAMLLAAICVNFGVGQQTETRPALSRAESTRQTEPTQLDRPLVEFFASKLVLCNNAQIQMSQFVATKSANSDVKKFAEMLGSDHASLNVALTPFIASYGEAPAGAVTDRVSAKKPVVIDNADASRAPVDANSKIQPETVLNTGDKAVLNRLFEICQAAHVNQMSACKDMLTQKSGSEFDKAYIGSQVIGHMALVAELKALESQSPKDFQIVIRDATASVEGHMQKAVSICKALDNQKVKTETSDR